MEHTMQWVICWVHLALNIILWGTAYWTGISKHTLSHVRIGNIYMKKSTQPYILHTFFGLHNIHISRIITSSLLAVYFILPYCLTTSSTQRIHWGPLFENSVASTSFSDCPSRDGAILQYSIVSSAQFWQDPIMLKLLRDLLLSLLWVDWILTPHTTVV